MASAICSSPHYPQQLPAPRLLVVGDHQIELLPHAPYNVRYTPEVPVVGFAFETQAGVHAIGSDRLTEFRTRPNSLAFIPAGCDVISRSSSGGEYLRIQRGSGPQADGFGEHPLSDQVDPAAISAAQKLRRMLLMRGVLDVLEVEREVLNLHQAVERVLTGAAPNPRASRWMTPSRLKRVDEVIEARLDGELTVHQIARSLDLSAGFFSRALKAAIGKTPHDYVIDRRIARARLLLRTTRMDLSEIAAACGFASHAHMTTQLRRRIGATPSMLRDLG